MLVHVNGLVFLADFVVLDTKGYSGGSIILGRLFLATRKENLDIETGELILKFNKEKVVVKVYDGHCIWRTWILAIIWRKKVAK